MQTKLPDRERLKMLETFSVVSSLAFMTVADFILAYLGGDWLDAYFATGDHRCRTICVLLALVTLFLTYFHLLYNNRPKTKDNGSKHEN